MSRCRRRVGVVGTASTICRRSPARLHVCAWPPLISTDCSCRAIRAAAPTPGTRSTSQRWALTSGMLCPARRPPFASRATWTPERWRSRAIRLAVRARGIARGSSAGDRALHGISALSCPSSRFCLIGGEQGGVRWSIDPDGGPRAWHQAEIVPGPGHWPITGVSCRSARFCVAIDSRSRAYRLRRS